MFNLTPNAARQISAAASAAGAAHMALRIAAKPEADGSLHYGMGFDDVQDDDMNLTLEGVAVVIAAPHQALLEYTTLDYVELQPGEFNFIFIPDQVGAETTAAPPSGACGSGGCGSCGGSATQ